MADFSGNPTKLYEGEAVDFTDLSTGNPDSWLWEFEGGVPANSADQNPSGILYPVPGLYDVTLTVSGMFGTDVILKESYIDVMPVGVNEPSEPLVGIYPNPNEGSFCLNNPFNEDLTISIYSAYGQPVNQNVMKPGENIIMLVGVSKGIYSIWIRSKDGSILGTKHIVIY